MVVLACPPTTERLIKGAVLATINAMAAVTVRASGKSIGSAIRVATVQAQRGQRAFAPGGSSGNSCSRSQSGQAMVSMGSGHALRICVRSIPNELTVCQKTLFQAAHTDLEARRTKTDERRRTLLVR